MPPLIYSVFLGCIVSTSTMYASQVRRMKLDFEEERSRTDRLERSAPFTEEEADWETRKMIDDYKFRAQKAEQVRFSSTNRMMCDLLHLYIFDLIRDCTVRCTGTGFVLL